MPASNVYGPVVVDLDGDLGEVRCRFTEEEVVQVFERTFLPRSGLNVVELVNLVFLFRTVASS